MVLQELERMKVSIANDFRDIRLFAMTNYTGFGDKPKAIKFSILNEVVVQLRDIVNSYLDVVISEMNANEMTSVPIFDYNQDQILSIVEQGEMFGAGSFELEIATDYFSLENVQLNRVRAWVVKVVAGTNVYFFIQKFIPSKMVIKDGMKLIRREDTFGLVGDEILSIRPSFDCLFNEESFLVNNMDSFESIFGFDVAYREKTESFFDQAAIGQLSRDLSVEGAGQLRDKMLMSKRFVRKLAAIMNEKRFEKIDLERLSDVVGEYDLPLAVDVHGRKIVVREDTTCEALLSVLNDEYNISMTTPYKYLVQKKKQL